MGINDRPPDSAQVEPLTKPPRTLDGLGLFRASDLIGKPKPPREWLVPDMIPARNVCLLYGDGGTGKSLLSLQLACAVATGSEWLGIQVAEGSAIFISAEDERAELHRRLVDISTSSGCALPDRLALRSLAGEDALLADLDREGGGLKPTELFTKLETATAQIKPRLVVLDTLSDLFPGNENDRALTRQFVGQLRGLALRQNVTVLVLAHPSRSGMSSGSGDSGSTAWSNSVRSRLYLTRCLRDGVEANPDARILSTKKMNYGPTGLQRSLTYQEGVFVAHAGGGATTSAAHAEAVFLKLLRQTTDQGHRVNASGGTTYAPTFFSELPGADGVNKRAFRLAMKSLLASGIIEILQEGPPSRRTSFLAEVKK